METYSRQEMFNKTWDYFITKGNPPGYDVKKNTCSYLGCAIGIHLKEKTRKTLQKAGSGSLRAMRKETPSYYDMIKGELRGDDFNFWLELQAEHDINATIPSVSLESIVINPDFHADFKKAMIRLARDYKLTIPNENNKNNKGETNAA